MIFLTEPTPRRGVLLPVLPGIHRLVADNPGPMTCHGTNTYLIEGPDGVSVLDPGPDDAGHVADIVRLSPGPVTCILLSHTHRDHLGATAALQARTGAPTAGWHRSAEPGFAPDRMLRDGDWVAGLQALHTPGHAADHLCFAHPDGFLFSADHVMAWSSSVVSPPGGDMAAYFTSLGRLLARSDTTYLPGHGPMLADPRSYVRDLLAHRQARERSILAAIGAGPSSTAGLVDALYHQLDPMLRQAAERNVVAHLEKLRAEGRAVMEGGLWVGLPA